ncbi:TolC family protein [uncultured Christiangramia sp.]|uniref:TolC family protein n=1 Tax=Christiangramia sp. 3-2217-3z TaxID=3417564 RepID=UPI0026344DF3|nr:TolC family protein [uncultured Christiangramia sp.]
MKAERIHNNLIMCKNIILVTIFIVSLFTFHSLQSQQLQDYQNLALGNNPAIQSMNSSVEIASEKINEANTLSDTEFGVGYYVSEPETRTGAQKLRLSVRQMMPWFGTINSRRNYAGSMVGIEEAELEIARRKLKLNVAQVYFELYEVKRKMEVLEKNVELLEVYRTMALNSVEVGKASAVEVLRLKMRQNDLLEKLRNLELTSETLENEFTNLLNSEDKMVLEWKDSISIPPQREDNRSLQLHPELQRYDRFAESVKTSEELNQLESAPKLGFGIDYISVQERKDMMVPDNGKDIIMPMLSFSVPVFNKKYKSVSRQNDLKLEQIDLQRANTLNDLNTRLQTALNERAAARIKYETQLDNLSQAKNAEELLLKQYETGTIDFDDVLDIQEIQLQLQMSLIEAVSNWYKKDAVVQYLTTNN